MKRLVTKKEDSKGQMRVANVILSSKHQITLPADIVRDLGLEPGKKYIIASEGGRIVLYPDKHTTTEYFAGSLEGTYGRTKEEIDAYLAEVSGDWGTIDDVTSPNS